MATLVTIATRKAVTVLPARAPLGGVVASAERDGASFARRFGLLIAEVRPLAARLAPPVAWLPGAETPLPRVERRGNVFGGGGGRGAGGGGG